MSGLVNWVSKNKTTIGAAALISGGIYYLSSAKTYPTGRVQSVIPTDDERFHSGLLVAQVLKNHGVTHLFTLCGGHVSPVLVGSKDAGIEVIDVRHEVNTVFCADAFSRLTGTIGVAVVTAGPGVTNTVTAVKNAQMAQSPVLLIGGASPTILKGRGALQDIDQYNVLKSTVKHLVEVKTVRDVVPALEQAIYIATSGEPGPVFVEFPVDVLYPETDVLDLFGGQTINTKSIVGKITKGYIDYYCWNIFRGISGGVEIHYPAPTFIPQPTPDKIAIAAQRLSRATKPVFVIGSQATLDPSRAQDVQAALIKLGVPCYLSGMGRGLLGKNELHIRHNRRNALRETDFAILVGVKQDFRLDYGNGINFRAFLVSVNRSKVDLVQNRTPDLGIYGDGAEFIIRLAEEVASNTSKNWAEWFNTLQGRDQKRNDDIHAQGKLETDHFINPIYLCEEIEKVIDDKSILIGDGGDFVGTASYVIRPRGPLNWLDPGPFGTLGVGMGFAVASKLAQPDHEVWVLFGDGACGFSFMEWDTARRFNTPIIAIIGNDACYTQILRSQVDTLQNDVSCMLEYSDYHLVAEALGAKGYLIDSNEQVAEVLQEAKKQYAEGFSVVINCKIGKTDFRKGSISL